DASSNDYWSIESSYFTESGHAVPLVGGMTAAEVGFIPIVGQRGGGVLGGGYSPTIHYGDMMTARYSISDATGRVLESRSIPFLAAFVSPYPGARLSEYHNTASYLAKRIARVQP